MSICLRTVPLLLSALLLVRAHAVRANELETLFKDSVVFTNVGYTCGMNIVSNFPLKVDISSARPNGFLYDLAGGNASRLRFNYHFEYTDHATNAVLDTTVDFAVTNWNTEGVSTLYVRLPKFNADPRAKLTMYWNPEVPDSQIPENHPDLVPYPVESGSRSADWNKSIADQEKNANYIGWAPAHRRGDHGVKLLNYWLQEPWLTVTSWKQGGTTAKVVSGTPASPDPEESVEYFDRSDNASFGEVQPVTPGSYRAVVTIAECGTYAALTKDLEFEITSGSSVGGIAMTNDFASSAVYSVKPGFAACDNGRAFLVKISQTDGVPAGFRYDSLTFGATEAAFYSDVRFYDEKSTPLNYEIRDWNPPGDSYIWVQCTNLTENSRIVMCWNQGSGTELPANDAASVLAKVDPDDEIKWFKQYDDNYSTCIAASAVQQDPGKQLKNRWKVAPSFSVPQWHPGETPAVVTPGVSYGSVCQVSYYDRSTGARLEEFPTTQVGEYRAVFRCEESAAWSELETLITFRIVRELGDHTLGEIHERVLLANGDWSVSGAEVYGQSYDDNDEGWGLPYWTHHERGSDADVSDYDPTKLFSGYNLFAGTYHEFVEDTAAQARIWGLENVRFGNLFNNGRYHPGEQGETGLLPTQNYLPWNPASLRMLAYEGLEIGQFHRYAGTFLLQNVADDVRKRYAQICSPCYTNGIGTIYFDIVNAFTGNVRDEDGDANYAIVVEVATNVVGTSEAPVDKAIRLMDGTTVRDYYFYADWHAVPMVPVRFHDDTGDPAVDCETLPETDCLELDVTAGGTCRNFYRVYVPVNVDGAARFRIRRTRIDKRMSLNPDADAFIIVDNLICSPAREVARLVPYGKTDPALIGKQYLGQEAAFMPAFPGPRDPVYARMKALDKRGQELEDGLITAATMHYRWRYLDQRVSDWKTVDFNPTTYTVYSPLILPGLPGDIEFWFEGTQNYGYYSYANYSGTRLGLVGYSESYMLITNGWNGVSTDWRVRIREGASDYESAVMIVREPGAKEDKLIPMELVDDGQWRGYYQTLEQIGAGVDVRFELRNLQHDGAPVFEMNTNRLYCAEKGASLDKIPYSGKLTANATADDWTHIPVDAATGYLMVQIDESTFGASFVRAAYQNFNHWTDGYGTVFVGVAADTNGLPSAGVSPRTRDFISDYSALTADVATNRFWRLDFSGDDYTYYKTFASGNVDGWQLGKGRFVYGNYLMPSSGTALQMSGASEGYVQMSDMTLNWPRGIEKIVFNARLAQSIDFDDFSYRDNGALLSNYVFTANVAFDHDSNCAFTGNASLSMIAYYQRATGCYEARWEQVLGKIDAQGTVSGPEPRGQRLSIYRWNRNRKNGYDRTLLCAVTNSASLKFNIPESEAALSLRKAKMLPMSIAAYNIAETNTMIVVGFDSRGNTAGRFDSGSGWRYVAYCDNAPDRLVRGSYGVLTANSPGLFVSPRYGEFVGTPAWGFTLPSAGEVKSTASNCKFPTECTLTSCEEDVLNGLWVDIPGRCEKLEYTDAQGTICGFRAADVMQTIDLIASPAVGTEDYSEKIASFSLSNNWGRIMSTREQEKFGVTRPFVCHPGDAKFRLRTGGNLDDRTSPGVVIDNIQVYQWRGRNEIGLYKSGENYDRTYDYEDNPSKYKVESGDPDNFVYTGAWIKDGGDGKSVLELSAKRTLEGRPTGVRTPLMDGKTRQDGAGTRGNGIGNLGFTYRNAQTNTVVLVQVAHLEARKLESATKDPSTNDNWRTVARFDYKQLGSSGNRSVTFGLRNREASIGYVARLVLDPEVVKSVRSVDDPTAFGSIDIEEVTCQDEPPIDTSCWWGWNIRTLGDAADTERRMYLPDGSMHPVGYSLALNNSVLDEIDVSKKDFYRKHMPFLQTPTFTNNVVGQVTFRARKYSCSDRDQAAEIALYGITREDLDNNREWTALARFTVSNTLFTAYNYRIETDTKYCAFRFGVTGVSGVDPAERGPKPDYGRNPVRVLIEEVVVSEAITPELAFRNVGAFRTDMSGRGVVADGALPVKSEQPICGEGWGVQCELFAVMLGDEIDKSHPPRVKLYWYEGNKIWGWDNWKTREGVHSGWLARAEGTDSWIFRSSYETAPEAVIPQSEKKRGANPPVVQYMLEVYYTIRDTKTGVTREERKMIDVSNEWTVPDWYAPLDYNTNPYYGAGKNRACFCILDDLAPGWAWINEVNLFSRTTSGNDDDNCQYVEIAAPRDADLTGWRIEMVEPHEQSDFLITNTVAVFGSTLAATKSVNITSNYVFHVLANPEQEDSTHDRSPLKRTGALDGTWSFADPTILFKKSGVIGSSDSFGIRLLRRNGIVEHSIVVCGTNIYTSAYLAYATPTGVVGYLNRAMKPSAFFHPGQDNVNGDHSVGVFESQGESASVWNNTMRRTPGEINEGQQINENIPTPFGDMMAVYFDLDQSGGNIRQSLDGFSFTNGSLRTYIRNGTKVGTNVTYAVDSWYEIASAKQTDGDGTVTWLDVTNGFDRTERKVVVTVGKGCSNRVIVVAKAKPDKQLRELGCDDKNAYTPAVIKWLQGGRTLRGVFQNNDGVIKPAEFWGLHSGYEGLLPLTVMYWLDIDPTAGGMVFQAGMSKPPTEIMVEGYKGSASVTNLQMSVFMMITNRANGEAWSPYVLRALEPGDCSTNYTAGSGNVWTSATFKISGILPNGHTSESLRDNWVDLRWFIFQSDSFYQPSDEPAHPRFTTDIEIRDPMNCKDSPGYGAGWYDWIRDPEHPEQATIRPFFRWNLDTRLKPFQVETLRKNNTYTDPTP